MAVALNRQAISLRQANSDDMAKVEYAFPVDKIHGKVSKRHNVSFAYRKESGRKYTNWCSPRSTKFSQDELARQERFGAVSVATKERLMDPSHLAADQVAFAKQSKYKTLRQYVWHQCAAEYDEANS